MGLSITVGTCYFSGEDEAIKSWKVVCGSGLGADAAASDGVNTTMAIGSMMSTSEMTMTDDTASVTSRIAVTSSVLTTTTHLVSDHTVDPGKTPPAPTTHTCNGNCTWTNSLGPTSTKQPGFQTGGPGMNTNGAEVVGLDGWRQHVVKGLMAMGAAEALWGFL